MKKLLLITIIFICSVDYEALSAQVEYTNYDRIDTYADRVPLSVQHDINDLANYLVKPASNDFEKIRSIFRWVTQNINYDMGRYFKQSHERLSVTEILEQKIALCDGYSNLMAALSKAAGLEMAVIYGYSKGYGYTTGDSFLGSPNHAWNAVKINRKWYLIDATWGAGYINEDNRFIKKFQEYYFLTPAEKFIYDHFPENDRWQLQDHTISLRDFQNMPNIQPALFEYGLNLKSHQQNTIRAYDNLQIDFYAPDHVSVIGQLERDGREISSPLTFSQRKSGQYSVFVQFPDAGPYLLKIYVKAMSEPGEYKFATEYKVNAEHEMTNPGFPITFASFNDSDCYLFEPMQRNLNTDQVQKFKIFVPGAFEVVLKNNDKWHLLNKQGQMFEGQFQLQSGIAGLYAKFTEGSQFNGLLEWECE